MSHRSVTGANGRTVDRHKFLALAFLVDGCVGLLATIAPGLGTAYRPGLASVSVFALVLAIGVMALGRHLGSGACEGLVTLGNALIALAIVSVGNATATATAMATLFGMAYLGAMLYILMWLPVRRAGLHIGAGCVFYLLALLYLGRGPGAVALVGLQTVGELGIALSMVQFVAGVRRLSSRDRLTGLANSEVLRVRLENALGRASRQGRHVGLLVLDLDDFGYVNRAFGSAAGDRVLQVAAERLLGSFRSNDTVARLHGNTFAVLLADLPDARPLRYGVASARAALDAPYELGEERTISLGVSLGSAIGPGNGREFHDLLRHAESAMGRAKDTARAPRTVPGFSNAAEIVLA